jgi:hypothetical protein
MTKLLHDPREALTDPEAFMERWGDADQPNLEHLAEKIRREEFSADLVWGLRKKMVEEAKASLQKQPKRSQTR